MKKRISLLLITTMVMSMLAGCGATETNEVEDTAVEASVESIAENTVEVTEVAGTEEVVETEPPHEHVYTEEVITALTCETNGVIKYTCECGDTYTDEQLATGHVFETYTSNNDATYTADGTETAKCNNCDVTDTRTAEGSMLTYTYTDMDATMYAQKTVNVRSLPNTDGEKLGSLSTNDEVKVTGQCAETSWYRIEYNGGVAYVSNSYLGNDKVVVQTTTTTTTQNVALNSYAEAKAYAISLGYPIGQAIDNGDGTAYCYNIGNNSGNPLNSEDSALHSADVNSARDCAGAMFGFGVSYFSHDENSGAHIVKLGNGWTVYRFTYVPRPDKGM